MATNITTNATASISGVNAGKKVHLIGTGTWGGAAVAIQIPNTNGTYVQYPTNGSWTANFSHPYQLGEADGLNLVSTNAHATTDIYVQAVEIRPS